MSKNKNKNKNTYIENDILIINVNKLNYQQIEKKFNKEFKKNFHTHTLEFLRSFRF